MKTLNPLRLNKLLRLMVIYSVLVFLIFPSNPSLAASQKSDIQSLSVNPTKPIRLIVPWPPGGTADTLARIVSAPLAIQLEQNIVIDNRVGASSTVGTAMVANVTPNGQTLLYADVSTMTINASFYPKLAYNTLTDLTPISKVGVTPLIMVVNSNGSMHSVQELIALSKANPGRYNFSSAGNGSTLHLGAEMFLARAGISWIHVPYKGGSPAISALLSSEVQMNCSGLIAAMPHIQAGSLRALATTHPIRLSSLPEVPALAELYPGFQVLLVNGLLGPKGLPDPVVNKLREALLKVLASKDLIARFEALGVEPQSSTPSELFEWMKGEISRYAKIVKQTGIHAD